LVKSLSERYKYCRFTDEEKRRLVDVIVGGFKDYSVELAVLFGCFAGLEDFRDVDIAVYKWGF